MSNERVTLDLTGDSAGTTPTAAPKGWYPAVIYSAEDKETREGSKSGAGNPFLATVVTLTEPGDFFEKQVRDTFIAKYPIPTYAGALNKAKQLARIAGVWDGEDESAVVLPDAEDVEGLEVEVLLTVEVDQWAMDEYEEENGEAPEEPIYRNGIRAYRPVGGWPRPGATSTKGKAGGKKKAVVL